MNRALYPADWDAIATRIKTEAKWQCQKCGRPCRPPGIDWHEFVATVLVETDWVADSFEEVADDGSGETGVIERWGRFKLTVAHLDQNPGNNDPANLMALCSPCHLRHDAIAHGQTRRRRRRERLEAWGQGAIACPCGEMTILDCAGECGRELV